MSKDSRKEKIRAELEKIRKKHGGVLRATDVWKEAKNPRHPLHGEFEWDVQKAAEAHWTEQANALIRYVTVVVVSETKRVTVPSYVPDPLAPSNTQNKIPLSPAEMDRTRAKGVICDELKRCESAIERARAVASILETVHPGLSDLLESRLGELIELRQQIQRAA